MPDLRPEAAEALGVFFIVLAGGGAVLARAGDLAVALAFGFAVAVLVYALGHVCGAHFNPAITLAFAATRHFPWRRVPAYIAAQALGAVLGAATLLLAFDDVGAATTQVAPHVSRPAGFAIEALATFLLALVIIAVATDARAAQGMAGLAIGLAVAVDALWAGPLTGASLNPARTIGPALVAGAWSDLWLYLVAPVLGACAAMAVYEWLRGARKPVPGEALGALGPVHLAQES